MIAKVENSCIDAFTFTRGVICHFAGALLTQYVVLLTFIWKQMTQMTFGNSGATDSDKASYIYSGTMVAAR